jgi:hypothetical protein
MTGALKSFNRLSKPFIRVEVSTFFPNYILFSCYNIDISKLKFLADLSTCDL